jgi:hypothetical protein
MKQQENVPYDHKSLRILSAQGSCGRRRAGGAVNSGLRKGKARQKELTRSPYGVIKEDGVWAGPCRLDGRSRAGDRGPVCHRVVDR